jgi:hypothetical protein
MATYLVISDNFEPAKRGETLTDEQLAGTDIQALIESGHLQFADPPLAPPEPAPIPVSEPAAVSEPLTPAPDPPPVVVPDLGGVIPPDPVPTPTPVPADGITEAPVAATEQE